MAATVKPVLRTSKLRDDGRAPIWIRITANRRSRYISTKVYIEPKYWNERKSKVRKTHELATAYNNKIKQLWLRCEKAALDAHTAQAAKDEVKGSGGSFLQYVDRHISRLRRRDQYWQRKKYNTTLNKLKAALGSDLSWNDLTAEALEQLEHYCREERGNNPNTTLNELKRVRKLVKQAIRDGVISVGSDPFLRYDMPQAVPADRHALTFGEIKKLQALDLRPGSAQRRDRDAFLLAFYGGGVRISDICRLRPSMVKDGRLRYRMMKTGRWVDIELPPPALQIVEHWKEEHGGYYLFPYLKKGDEKDPERLRKRIASRTTVANRNLKELAHDANIDNADEVTTHVARHSFARYAQKQPSSDVYDVSKALAHKDVQTTEQYLAAFNTEAVDNLTRQMWKEDNA